MSLLRSLQLQTLAHCSRTQFWALPSLYFGYVETNENYFESPPPPPILLTAFQHLFDISFVVFPHSKACTEPARPPEPIANFIPYIYTLVLPSTSV